MTFNHGVEGSSPSALTKEIKHLVEISKIQLKARVGTVLANRLPWHAGMACVLASGLGAHDGGLVVDRDRLRPGCDRLGAGAIDNHNLQPGD
jgi:hypothetical protein